MPADQKPKRPAFTNGDLVKPLAIGSHAMTVTHVGDDGSVITASYTSDDGRLHHEDFAPEALRRVVF